MTNSVAREIIDYFPKIIYNVLMEICPLCQRPLVSGPSVNEHHLIPKTFGGKVVVRMHRICHNKIHSLWTERELLNYYHTFERIAEHEDIRKFVAWVKKKSPEYYDSSKRSSKRR